MTKTSDQTTAVAMTAFILLAGNLRPALTSVGPLIDSIRQTTQISPTAAGLLTGLPLLAFGVFGPLGHLGRRFGIERMLVAALILLTVGILVRSLGSVAALFAGSACLAAGIAVGSALIIGIIKRDFSHREKEQTTVYVVVLGLCAAIASGLAIPLSNWLPGGWRTSLAIWALPAFVTLVVWLPPAIRSPGDNRAPRRSASASLWRSFLAWQVTAFMGLQSLLFYVAVSWFPTLFQSNGYSPAEAGLLTTQYQLIALAVTPIVPFILRYAKDQSVIAFVSSLVIGASVCGLLAFPDGTFLWMVLMGIGGGICLTLAMAFISLRTANHHDAASLSIMSQSLGYCFAATGPFTFGLMYDLSGNWTSPLLLLATLASLLAIVGLGAGRNRTIAP